MYEMEEKIRNFFSLASIKSTAISPDGNNILYIVSMPNNEYSKYVESLYLQSEYNLKLLKVISMSTINSPQWSPSGNLFAVNVNGNINIYEVEDLNLIEEIKVEGKITLYAWGENDNLIWVVSEHSNIDNLAPFSVGTFNSNTDVCLVDIFEKTIEKLGHENEGAILDICRSYKGDILFYARRANNIYDAANRINVIDSKSKTNKILIDEGLISVLNFVGCLADERIIFAGLDADPHNASLPKHYFYVDSIEGKVSKLLIPINNRGSGVEAKIYDNGNNILFREPMGTKNLFYNLENKIVTIEKSITHFSINKSGKIALVQQDFYSAPEIFTIDINNLFMKFEPKQISFINKNIEESSLPQSEIIYWRTDDNEIIEGILIYPINFNKGAFCKNLSP